MGVKAFRTLTIAALSAAGIASAPAAAVELIVNGGFENTLFGGTVSYYNVGNTGADHAVPADFGFAVPVNNVDIIANGVYTPALATGGAYNLDLVGYGSTGSISQTFNTVLGALYNVSLDYNVNGSGTADVTVDAMTLGTITGSSTWQTFTSSFIGTGAAVNFAITEVIGGGSGGVVLDNISVTTVPEPASWALLIVGFAMVGVAARRRNALAA